MSLYNGTSWSSGPNPPATLLRGSVGAGTQNAGIWGGAASNPQRCCSYEFDGSSWATGVTMTNGGNQYDGGGGGTQNDAIATTGFSPASLTSTYNGTTWSSETNPPRTLSYAGIGGGSTTLLRTAGCNGSPVTGKTTCVDSFNGTSWATENSLSVARSWYNSRGGNSSGFVTAGGSDSGPLGTSQTCVEEYDGTNWSAGSALPTGFQYGGSGGSNSNAWVAGNYPASTTFQTYEAAGSTALIKTFDYSSTTGEVGATGSFTGSFTGDGSGLTGVANATSASYATTASYALNAGGGSTDTGSLLITASAANNVITFTKGDASTFAVTVDTGSGGGGGGVTSVTAGTGISVSTPTGDITICAPGGGGGGGFPYTGIANISGSLIVSGSSTLLVKEFSTGTWSSGPNSSDLCCCRNGGGDKSAYILVGGSPACFKTELYDGSAWSGGPNAPITTVIGTSAGSQNAFITTYRDTCCTALYDGANWSTAVAPPVSTCRGGGVGTQNDTRFVGGGALTTNITWDGSSYSTDTNTPTNMCDNGAFGLPNSLLTAGVTSQLLSQYCNSLEWNGSAWSDGPNTGQCYSHVGGLGASFYNGGFAGSNFPAYNGTSEFDGITLSTGGTIPVGIRNIEGSSTNGAYSGFLAGGTSPALCSSVEYSQPITHKSLFNVNNTTRTLNSTGSFTGSFSGDGSGLTNLDLTAFNGNVGLLCNLSTTGSVFLGACSFSTGTWSAGPNSSDVCCCRGGGGDKNAYILNGGSPTCFKTELYDGSAWSDGADGPIISTRATSAGSQNAFITTYRDTCCTALYDGANWSTAVAPPVSTCRGGGVGTQNDTRFVGGGVVNTNITWDGTSYSSDTATPSGICDNGAFGLPNSLLTAGVTPPSIYCNSLEWNGSAWSDGPSTGQCYSGVGGLGANFYNGGFAGGNFPAYTATSEFDGSVFSTGGTIPVGIRNIAGSSTNGAYSGFLAGGTSPAICASVEYSQPTTIINILTSCNESRTISATGSFTGSFTGDGSGLTNLNLEGGTFDIDTAGDINTCNLTASGSVNFMYNSYGVGSWSSGPNSATTTRCCRTGGGTKESAILVGGTPAAPCVELYDGSSWSTGTCSPMLCIFTTIGVGTQNSFLTAYTDSCCTSLFDGSAWTNATAPPNRVCRGAGVGTQNDAKAVGGICTTCNLSWNGSSWSADTALPSGTCFNGAIGVSDDLITTGIRVPGVYCLSLTWDGSSWADGPSTSNCYTDPAGMGDNTYNGGIAGGDSPACTSTEEYDGSAWSVGGTIPVARKNLASNSSLGACASFIGGGSTPSVCTFQVYSQPFSYLPAACTDGYTSILYATASNTYNNNTNSGSLNFWAGSQTEYNAVSSSLAPTTIAFII